MGEQNARLPWPRGKAEHDKRDTIKDREGKREVERAMKSRNR
jgi:SsrA-binding protein